MCWPRNRTAIRTALCRRLDNGERKREMEAQNGKRKYNLESGSTKWKMGGEFGKWKDEMEIGRMALVGHHKKEIKFQHHDCVSNTETMVSSQNQFASFKTK